jgi:tol-pal system protein YbgF
MRLTVALALVLTSFCLPTYAQEDTDAMAAKLSRLERDLTFLQKQVYRGKSSDGGEISTAPAGSGGVEVRLSQMSEELRQLRGNLEQLQFANRQLATDVKKLSDDVEYRLHALEEKQTAAAQAAPEPVAPAAAPTPVPAEPAAPAKFEPEKKPAPAKPAVTGNDFPDANTHYSHAFKLLNDKKYSEASASFDNFVKKYPSDPLTANAFYWLGESYYARADFTRSAESFRKGFEANPDGQKAPDNLFKLAKSLGQVKRTNESCIVLTQVTKKYAEAAPRIAKRAEEERLAMQCK